ncbi:hypothetical protein B0H14DRAFT_3854133, partial [Mycena olivaceomarginata]
MGRYARGAGRGQCAFFSWASLGRRDLGSFCARERRCHVLSLVSSLSSALERVRLSRFPGLVCTGTPASGSVFLGRLCPRLRGAVSLAARAFEMLGIAHDRSLPFRSQSPTRGAGNGPREGRVLRLGVRAPCSSSSFSRGHCCLLSADRIRDVVEDCVLPGFSSLSHPGHTVLVMDRCFPGCELHSCEYY